MCISFYYHIVIHKAMENLFNLWILPIFAGFAAAALLFSLFSFFLERIQTQAIKKQFRHLLSHSKGRIIGLSYDYIHKYCGPPDSAAPVGNGIKHCIWQRGRCAVSLLFDEQDMCVGIDHISI